MRKISCTCLLWFQLASAGCTFNFELTSQRTALENQVMGVYQELDDEVLLLSTMRGPDNKRARSKGLPGDVLSHRQNQDFNRDDLEELKDLGLIGERSDGYVALVEPAKDQGKDRAARLLANTLVREENKDREAIWQHILKKIPNAPSMGVKQVGRAYGEMQRTKLRVGQWYQNDHGTWEKKSDRI